MRAAGKDYLFTEEGNHICLRLGDEQLGNVSEAKCDKHVQDIVSVEYSLPQVLPASEARPRAEEQRHGQDHGSQEEVQKPTLEANDALV